MKIACLGWGSLIWKPGALPLADIWHKDGPLLPVEFCRIGDGGELATALCTNALPVPVMWAELTSQDLTAACLALREREAIPDYRGDGIGILTDLPHAAGPLATWARARHLDALIWTDLPPRYQHIEGRIPSCEEAKMHLSDLTGEKAEHACEYIRRVPAQISTLYRPQLQHFIERLAEQTDHTQR